MALLKSRADFIPDAPVEPKPFTPDIHGLIAWLETQDGETEYTYMNAKTCVLAAFAEEAFGLSYYYNLGGIFDGPKYVADLKIAEPSPRTYSAALSRARAFAAKMGEQ